MIALPSGSALSARVDPTGKKRNAGIFGDRSYLTRWGHRVYGLRKGRGGIVRMNEA